MTDLTQNASLRATRPNELNLVKMGCDTSEARTIYAGTPLFLDINVDSVYLSPFDSGVTLATGDAFHGIAAEKIVFALGDREAENLIEFYGDGTVLGMNMTQYGGVSFVDADAGKSVYMSDSGTLTLTAGSNLLIGELKRVEDGFVFVKIKVDQS